MKKINEYKNRFNQLLESQLGNVKPLINEQQTTKGATQTSGATPTLVSGPFGKPPVQYYVYNSNGKFLIYQTNATIKTPTLLSGTPWNNNGQGYKTKEEAERIIQNSIKQSEWEEDEDENFREIGRGDGDL